MAAAYAFHIAQNQCFVDGNKRTGLDCALTFLEANGITVDDSDTILYQAMFDVGNRQLTKEGLSKLFESMAE